MITPSSSVYSASSVLKTFALPCLCSAAFRLSVAGWLLSSVTSGSTFAQTVWIPSGTSGIDLSSNSNVGIGTATPASKLTVLGGRFQVGDGTNSVWVFGGSSGGLTAGHIGTINNVPLAFFASSSAPRMTLAVDGNVGIGTTSPAAKLHVSGDIVFDDSTSGAMYGIGRVDNDGLAATGIFANYGYGSAAVQLGFQNGGTFIPSLTARTSGNVGIGTITPQQKLDVAGHVRMQGLQLLGSGQLQVQWWNETDPVDQKYTELIQHDGLFVGRFVNDTYTQANNWLVVTRGVETYTTASVSFPTGNVGIGTTTPSHKLAVNGTIRAKEVIVDTGWADYVFAEDYRLAPLAEIEAHIREKGHLPGIPSAAEVAEHGVSLGEMQSLLLAKLEEVTLHLIRLEKENGDQSKRLAALEHENANLRQQLSATSLIP